jgi:hypothetical protein
MNFPGDREALPLINRVLARHYDFTSKVKGKKAKGKSHEESWSKQ